MKRDKKVMYYLLLQTRDGKSPAELANYSEDEKVYNAHLLIEDGYIRGKTLRGHDGKVITAVLEDLTSSGHNLLERMEGQTTENAAIESHKSEPSVFISHSSRDADLAEALIDLLRNGIGLTEEDIRCTSVDGYRFKVGADTDAQLKKEVKGSKTFIGLITPSSIQSAYVLFELGARWGAELHLAPVLARGADSSFLRGPLAGLNALNAVEEGQMHQLVNDIANQLEKKPASAAVYGKALQELIAVARIEDFPNLREGTTSKDILTYKIYFDHLPKNLLESGWTRAYPKDTSLKPEATLEPDAPVPGSININAPAGHAYDYRLPPNAIPSNRITFTAKYLNETMIFLLLVLSSKDGKERCRKWVKILVGANQAQPTPGYEDHEYTLVVSGKPLKGGWRQFDLLLPDVVRKTWGTHGLVFEGVGIIRLRSTLHISPICFYEHSS